VVLLELAIIIVIRMCRTRGFKPNGNGSGSTWPLLGLLLDDMGRLRASLGEDSVAAVARPILLPLVLVVVVAERPVAEAVAGRCFRFGGGDVPTGASFNHSN